MLIFNMVKKVIAFSYSYYKHIPSMINVSYPYLRQA